MEQIFKCSIHKDEGCLLYVAVASRGKPAQVAVGALIKASLNDKLSVVWRARRSIGKKTDEEAKFEALLFGLERALKSEYKHVTAMSCSEVLVKQFHGQLEVRSPALKSLLERVKEKSKKLCGFSLHYIPTSENAEANVQANLALDRAMSSGRLEEDSSCPVCLELFEPPVFQCPKGHLICRDCLESILENSNNESCPECRTPYLGQRIPNVVADDLIKQWRSQDIQETPIATYKLSTKYIFNIRSGPLMSSAKVGDIIGGSYVDIYEIKVVPQDNNVRGRMASGNWINIQGLNPSEVQAVPIPLGTYKIKNHIMPFWSDIRRSSTAVGGLLPGDYVDIVETRVVTEDDRVRARTVGGKWISLVAPSTGYEWALPVPLGDYQVLKELWLSLDDKGRLNNRLRVGDCVNIVETKVVPEDKVVRAKTRSGKWMSLVDTEDGTVWAKPADVACAECSLVFFDARARDQHFKASHKLLHCQGCVHHSCFSHPVLIDLNSPKLCDHYNDKT